METTLTDRVVVIGKSLVDKDRFYTLEETEEILGVSYATINRRVREGSLTRSGSARVVFYKGEDIVKFLETGRAEK